MDSLNDNFDIDDQLIHRGSTVPSDAVGLAWVKSPEMSPEENLIVVDLSNTIPENVSRDAYTKKVMYANELGILEDENGHRAVFDENPRIGDVFTVDEDYSVLPGSEYTANSILPFRHTSRFFHVDKSGITIGSSAQEYISDIIKVVDSTGAEYVGQNGKPLYKIHLSPAIQSRSEHGSISAYRVYAYVGTDRNEDLYITYDKCELSADGYIVEQDSNYRETLNPIPYFTKVPEESDVVSVHDPDDKIFATKSLSKKKHILGLNGSTSDGYKVYVPKKAIPDSRIFQLFRWRLKCDFVENYKVDPIREPKVVRAGVLVTNTQPNSAAPYAFYNLQKSTYNASGVRFINPLKTTDTGALTSATQQEYRSYWQVNLDSLNTPEGRNQIAKFDILLLCLPAGKFDLSKYLNIISYYVNTLGKVLIIESNNHTRYFGLGIDMTGAVNPVTGDNLTAGYPYNKWADIRVGKQSWSDDGWKSRNDEVFNENKNLGGWTFYDADGYNEYFSLSPYNKGVAFARYTSGVLTAYANKTQRFAYTAGTGWSTLITGEAEDGDLRKPVLIKKELGAKRGKIYASSCGIFSSVSQLFDYRSGKIQWYNANTRIIDTKALTGTSYTTYLNTHVAEGAYKLLYNMSMVAVKNSQLNNTDEKSYSSSWTIATDWKASWVINAGNGILTEEERVKHNFSPYPLGGSSKTVVWKRKLSSKNAEDLINAKLTTKQKNDVKDARRIYSLEVSNDNVSYDLSLSGTSKLHAWTTAYTPPFIVPPDFGPHIIKEDNIIGDYVNHEYTDKAYPPKPYHALIKASYSSTSQIVITKTVGWSAQLTATKTTRVPYGGGTVDKQLSWVEDGAGSFTTSTRAHEYGLSVPSSISTWQDENYYSSKWGSTLQSWPSWGMDIRLETGSVGEQVSFLQDALNGMMFFGIFNNPDGLLKITGKFDAKTKAAVLAFQTSRNAIFKDGIVDAETWFLIGNQIARIDDIGGFDGALLTGYKRYYSQISNGILKQYISNDDVSTGFLKRSAIKNGPKIVWDLIRIRFAESHKIHGITVTPYMPGGTKTMLLKTIDVRTWPFTLLNYDANTAKLKNLPYRLANNAAKTIEFGPYTGDTIVIGIGQDTSTGTNGTMREFGVREIVAHAESAAGGGTVFRETVVIPVSGTVDVTSSRVATVTPKIPDQGSSTLSNLVWSDVTLTGDDADGVWASINPTTGVITFRHQEVDNTNSSSTTTDGNSFVKGPALPPASGFIGTKRIYTMDENKGTLRVAGREISKADGIRLLCDYDKYPVGFPALQTGVTAHEGQIHYSVLTLNKWLTDASITVGFYDIRQKEFIRSADGTPEISYIEYMLRGPNNIYVAVMSSFENETEKVTRPPSSDTPTIPQKWAMPAYGVCTSPGSQIRIEVPKDKTSPTDMWSLPIRTGRFDKVVKLPHRSKTAYSGYLSTLQNKTVRAFYSVPEAKNVDWSSIFGRPYTDVGGEYPIVEDSNTIRVMKYPILAVKTPTVYQSDADPVRPIFKIYTRASVEDSWDLKPMSDITDYNLSTGHIHFKTPLPSTEPMTVKVDYTTASPFYPFVGTADAPLFLNPYLPMTKANINVPIHIYMYPEFVKVLNKKGDWVLVDSSVRTRTIYWAKDITSFTDPTSPQYDPLIVELGIVYVTNNVSMSDISMIDIRKRGGGLRENVTEELAIVANEDYRNNWDITPGDGEPYQNGGFVIVRLPASLKERFPDPKEVYNIVERNITAGVKFKIEDLDGNDWN